MVYLKNNLILIKKNSINKRNEIINSIDVKFLFLITFFYIFSHLNQTSGWLPPMDSWDSGSTNLPFGWESAVDKDGRTYYVK